MSDDFDLCECVWASDDLFMEHLLSLLRETQTFCSDNECFTFSRLPGPDPVQPSNNFFMTCLFFAFVVLMYVIRPRSLRRASLRSNVVKNRDDASGSNDDPPAPPTTAN